MTDEDTLLESYICGNSQSDESVYYLPPENLDELCRRLRTEQEIAARLITEGNLRPHEVFKLRWKNLELEEGQGVIQVGEHPADREIIFDSDQLLKLLRRKEQIDEEQVVDLSYDQFYEDLNSACDKTLRPFYLRRGKCLKVAKQENPEEELQDLFGYGKVELSEVDK